MYLYYYYYHYYCYYYHYHTITSTIDAIATYRLRHLVSPPDYLLLAAHIDIEIQLVRRVDYFFKDGNIN